MHHRVLAQEQLERLSMLRLMGQECVQPSLLR
jgi:hypothetical protein